MGSKNSTAKNAVEDEALAAASDALEYIKDSIEFLSDESDPKMDNSLEFPEVRQDLGAADQITQNCDLEAPDHASGLCLTKFLVKAKLVMIPSSRMECLSPEDERWMASIVPFQDTGSSSHFPASGTDAETGSKKTQPKPLIPGTKNNLKKSDSRIGSGTSVNGGSGKISQFKEKKKTGDNNMENTKQIHGFKGHGIKSANPRSVLFNKDFYRSVLKYKAQRPSEDRSFEDSVDTSSYEYSDSDDPLQKAREIRRKYSKTSKNGNREHVSSSTDVSRKPKNLELQVHSIDSRTREPEKLKQSPGCLKRHRKSGSNANSSTSVKHSWKRGENCRQSKKQKCSRIRPQTSESSESDNQDNAKFKYRLQDSKKSIKFINHATASGSIGKKCNKKSSKDLSQHKQKVARLNATIKKIAERNSKKMFAKTFRKRKITKRFNIEQMQDALDSKKKQRKSNSKLAKNQESEYGNDYWDVVKLLDARQNGNQLEYLIRWAGFWNDTWEPASNITPDLIVEYNIGQAVLKSIEIQKNIKTNTEKFAGFLDKRTNWNESGFKRGLKLSRIENKFNIKNETCGLVRFRGQAALEILRMKDVEQFLFCRKFE